MEWLDTIEGAERLAMRNAILVLPVSWSHLERNVSNDHRKQIVKALKHRIPETFRPKGQNPPLRFLDRANSRSQKRIYENEFKQQKKLIFTYPRFTRNGGSEYAKILGAKIGAGLKQYTYPTPP